MTNAHNIYEIVPLRRHIEKTTNGTTATQIDADDTAFRVTRIETISTGSVDLDKVGFVSGTENVQQFALREGDLLFSHINSMSVIGNSAPVTREVLPLYVGMNLLRLRPSSSVHPTFLAWCLKSDFVRHQVRQFAKPAINQASISTTNLKRVRAPLPDLATQRQIADFLDRETARIDLLIEKKQRLVALLGEKNAETIRQCVSWGMDSSVPKKPSRVPAADDLAAHWTEQRLSTICRFVQGKAHEPFIEDDGEYICVTARFVSTSGE
ncbi:restriction endonuclease subunit S, partial [Gemmobacter megaterium]